MAPTLQTRRLRLGIGSLRGAGRPGPGSPCQHAVAASLSGDGGPGLAWVTATRRGPGCSTSPGSGSVLTHLELVTEAHRQEAALQLGLDESGYDSPARGVLVTAWE